MLVWFFAAVKNQLNVISWAFEIFTAIVVFHLSTSTYEFRRFLISVSGHNIGIRVEYSWNYIQMIFYCCKKSRNHIQWYDYRLQNPCKLAGDILNIDWKHSKTLWQKWLNSFSWEGFWKFRVKCKNLVKRILKKKYKNANFLYKLKSIFFG